MKKMPAIYGLFLAFALLLGAPLATAGPSSYRTQFCPSKKKKKNNNKKKKKNSVSKSNPRVVGRRDPLKLPSLSSKAPKSIKTKPYQPPKLHHNSLTTYTPKHPQSIRVVGRVSQIVKARLNPKSHFEEEYIAGYKLDTSIGDVELTMSALQRGGQVIDLAPYVGHRIRVTGDGYFKDKRTETGLRYVTIRRVETE
jgi:hypothetical protein